MMQNLIAQFMQSRSEAVYQQILEQIRNQEVLWTAFSPVTRNYYTGMEHGEYAAYLFSEKAYFEKFQDELLLRNSDVAAVENKQANRMFMLADFYRSGIMVLIINWGEQYLAVNLHELIDDPSEQRTENKPVMNPFLLAKANFFLQEVERRRADTNLELDMLFEISKGTYLMPLQMRENKAILPVFKTEDGKQLLMFFTDFPELRKYDPKGQCTAKLARFAEMKAFCQKADGIIINPQGARIILDSQLLQAVEDAANGKLKLPDEKIVMNDEANIKITSPDARADVMLEKVNELLQERKEVNAVYLRMMHKDAVLAPSYLFILDASGDLKKLYAEIAALALPFANGLDLEFMSYQDAFARSAADEATPFYKKRRFRLFG